MGTYTVQKILRAGVVPTENAVAASDTFANDGKTFLIVTNGSGSPLTVTIVSQNTVDGLAVADPTVSIANGAKKAIGPFSPSVYNDSDDLVTVQYNETSSVTAAALKL